ncbi:MAG: acyltransferase family protein, partial [Chitinophagaceae bacterium]
MKYIKELDSVRAIAVLLVIVSHWISYTNPVINKFLHECGPIGVDIFFVLSGFLITWILLENHNKVLAN